MITLSTTGHIFVGSANHFDSFVVRRETLGKCRILATSHTHRFQLVDDLGHWNELENAVEVFAFERPIESGDQDHFAHVGDYVGEFDHIEKELTLVNANN